MGEFKLELQSGNAQFGSKSAIVCPSATLKFNGWPWKITGQLSYAASILSHHFKAIGEFKLEIQFGNAQFGRVTLKFDGWPFENNEAPLLSNIKLYASFHRHIWIQTGVTVWKRLSGVMISVTLTFDLWPRPFAWTTCQSMVISSKIWGWYDDRNIVKRVWQKDGGTYRQTDRRKEVFLELLGRN